MVKLMNFDANVREVFENNEEKLTAFKKLMMDTANGEFEEGTFLYDRNSKHSVKIDDLFSAFIPSAKP